MPAPATHGAHALERLARLGQLDAEAQETLDCLVAHYAEDGGGIARMSNREMSILRDVAFCDIIVIKVLAWAQAQGQIIDAEGRLLPVLGKSLLAYVNSKRLGLVALGLRPEHADGTVTACAACGDRFGDLDAYLRHKPACRAQPAPPVASPAALPAADEER